MHNRCTTSIGSRLNRLKPQCYVVKHVQALQKADVRTQSDFDRLENQ